MQRSDTRSVGKAAGDAMPLCGVPRHALLTAGLLAPTAWLLIGCGSGEDLVTTATAPAEQAAGTVHGAGIPLLPDSENQSAKLDVTPPQQAFLDALSAAGVHPSSELQALSIGSSVCQARAAGQSDQAVWEYIAPMVRSDVADTNSSPPPRTASDVQLNAATADYIVIATQRLC
ncbi:DUF732 domain-containing protein [Candidatus Mycolicibacterium alkanivorans]|uniref:DUF732 domain-containing protein n=1 Tax=Candidatus Mycolicibacterium alkanivorans TaxID=2954114 RepID=A0ABS9YSP2_9MYCO|nr:DUF732 domain-containing protein [Candidatus Mycolicibacterium alkanivorans]MCI4674250.1 DUF732 domain-containing protein [Candidatus Mycolicibacterium alkanivorans]